MPNDAASTVTLHRRKLLAIASASALTALAGPAVTGTALRQLYQARTIVTGRRDETRLPGLARCLADVLVRVSGDPRLAGHPLVEEFQRAPEAPVLHVSFRDLYAHRPIKDEQGTRDRPYEMTVEYDPAKVDALLARLGAKPWLAERPRLVVFLAVRHIGSSYILTSTVDQGGLQREAFAAASWQYGLDVIMPSERTIAKSGLTIDSLPEAPLPSLSAFVDRSVGEIPLAGNLVWNRQLLGWLAEWRLEHEGQERRWTVEGVNFDQAFRIAVGGAAQILSGNGAPA